MVEREGFARQLCVCVTMGVNIDASRTAYVTVIIAVTTTTLLGISLHALSQRLVQRTHVELSVGGEICIRKMFLPQEITRNLYQIGFT